MSCSGVALCSANNLSIFLYIWLRGEIRYEKSPSNSRRRGPFLLKQSLRIFSSAVCFGFIRSKYPGIPPVTESILSIS